jgi:glycosyltransferase involved in cell wall biosynthesis
LPSISVVMPTYRRAHGLRRVLAPLLADPAATEVVVVVDGSEDGSFELLQELAASHPALRPRFQANAGEAAARQTGIEHASGEIVLLLDDDVEAAPGLVAGHAAAHAGGEDAVVVGYMPPEPPRSGDPDAFSTLLYAEAYEARCRTYEQEPDSILRHLWAGNVSLPRAAALRVGMGTDDFQERYHPDRELGMRLLAAGLTGRFDRSLRATHLYERSLDAFVRDARSQGAGWTLVHTLHPEAAGELPEARFTSGLPAPLRAFVDVCRRPRAAALASGALTAGTRALGAAGQTRVQVPVARLLRRVEQQRGAIELARRA